MIVAWKPSYLLILPQEQKKRKEEFYLVLRLRSTRCS